MRVERDLRGALGPARVQLRLFPYALFLAALTLAGCDNMKHQSHSQPMDSTDRFADGTSARTPPAHTVATGSATGPMESGEDNGRPLAELPVPMTETLLARGQDRYGIYCAVCHGADGYGEGIVVKRGFPRPESFHSVKLRSAPAGELYQAIARGYGTMYPLADRIDASDRWAIVAYIRALQLSQHATIADVPEAERAALSRP